MIRLSRFGAMSLIILSAGAQAAQSLQSQVTNLIQTKLPHASVAVVIQDPESGKTLVSINPNQLLTPASNIKILTATAAYYALGAQYQYKTTLYKKDKDLYIRFTGNPALTVPELNSLLANLKDNTVEGDIILDDSRFKAPYHPAGTTYDDLGWYYEAPSHAIILNENKQGFTFVSGEKMGLPVQIKPEKDAVPALTLVNHLTTVTPIQEKEHCEMVIKNPDNNTLELHGCMAQVKQPRFLQFAIPHPEDFARQTVAQALQKNNIPFTGKIRLGKTPDDAEVMAEHHSKPLSALLAHMLQESDNLYADSITKTLGYKLTKEGSYKQGAYALKKILGQHTTLPIPQMVIYDGQGSRYNLVSAQQMMDLLNVLYHDKDAKAVILDHLAKAGVSGTLKDRLKKTPLEKKVLAKTGTMHDVSALSGLLTTRSGKPLLFAILINGVDGNILKAKEVEDAILTLAY